MRQLESNIMKKTILFGNGINLFDGEDYVSWEDLLKQNVRKEQSLIEDVPNPLQFEDLLLSNKVDTTDLPKGFDGEKYSEEYLLKLKLATQLKRKSNAIYEALIKKDIDYYLTTNYEPILPRCLQDAGYELIKGNSDFTEQVYSIRRHYEYQKPDTKKVKRFCPIHGEAKYPKTIMLGYDHYCGTIGKIDDYIKGKYIDKGAENNDKLPRMIDRLSSHNCSTEEIHSWIDCFFMTELHIIGFGLDFAEQDIWWLLNKRCRNLWKNKDIVNNRICFHGEINESKADLLRIFGVEVIADCTCAKESSLEDWTKMYLDIIKKI